MHNAIRMSLIATVSLCPPSFAQQGFVNDNINRTKWRKVEDCADADLFLGMPALMLNNAEALVHAIGYRSFQGNGYAHDSKWGAEQFGSDADVRWRRQDFEYLGIEGPGSYRMSAAVGTQGFVGAWSGESSASAGGFAEVTGNTSDGKRVVALVATLKNCALRSHTNTSGLGIQYNSTGGNITLRWQTRHGSHTCKDGDSVATRGAAVFFSRKHRTKASVGVYANNGYATANVYGWTRSTLRLN